MAARADLTDIAAAPYDIRLIMPNSLLLRRIARSAALLACMGCGWAQPDAFVRSEAMVPMRDGVRLHTNIFIPRNQSGPLPIIFSRTPYGAIGDPAVLWSNPNVQALAPDGYIFVYQDIRGRFGSEGQFVMFRQPAASPGGIDETTDAYDSIEWLIRHVPHNNGKVGMFGTSYGGWLTTMALLHPHPALKAASEQASPADQFLGDDFHHNGAFRLSYGFEYSDYLEASKTANTHFAFDRYDTYSWYLALGSLAHANELTSTAACPPGTISSIIRTMIPSGGSRPSRPISRRLRCRI
jgi:predicted acyl esterase